MLLKRWEESPLKRRFPALSFDTFSDTKIGSNSSRVSTFSNGVVEYSSFNVFTTQAFEPFVSYRNLAGVNFPKFFLILSGFVLYS